MHRDIDRGLGGCSDPIGTGWFGAVAVRVERAAVMAWFLFVCLNVEVSGRFVGMNLTVFSMDSFKTVSDRGKRESR